MLYLLFIIIHVCRTSQCRTPHVGKVMYSITIENYNFCDFLSTFILFKSIVLFLQLISSRGCFAYSYNIYVAGILERQEN